jgi:hypothetical protein
MTDVHEVLTCCLCDGPIEHKRTAEGKVYWTTGNDPWPMADEGRCCDVCADVKVLPMRFLASHLNRSIVKDDA